MEIEFKFNHPDSRMPVSSTPQSVGLDVFACDYPVIENNYIEYNLGFSVKPPDGYFLSIRPRSSISKYDLIMCNSPGTIDPDYRDNVKIRFKLTKPINDAIVYNKGDRIGQLILEKNNNENLYLLKVEELNSTERSGGFGSTGN